jgi:hypothetical protein
VPSSAATPSQAAAAAINGPDPGPVYMRPELISGGSAPKSMDYDAPDSNDMWFLASCLNDLQGIAWLRG